MAKAPQVKSGTTKIRFVMIDAEIPEGELNQVALAIQNALRPVAGVNARPLLQQQRVPDSKADVADADADELDETAGGETIDAESIVVDRPQKESRQRKFSTPKVLEVDLVASYSLENFATGKAPKNDTERFLTIAAWFKEHGGVDAITTDHIYTGYRALKWPSGIEDFNAPLRKLKNLQFFTSPERGKYAINHLGLSRVEELSKK